jgi:hypothetical protein
MAIQEHGSYGNLPAPVTPSLVGIDRVVKRLLKSDLSLGPDARWTAWLLSRDALQGEYDDGGSSN